MSFASVTVTVIGTVVVLDLLGAAVLRHQWTARAERVGSTTTRGRRDYRLLRLAMAIGWLLPVAPAVLEYRTNGRPELTTVGVASRGLSATPQLLSELLQLGLMAVLTATALHHLRIGGRPHRMWMLLLALAPWIVMATLAIHDNQGVSRLVLIYPLIMVAVMAAAPPLSVFATLGWLTIATAALSLVLGLSTDYATVNSEAFVDKFGWSSALAGPFGHPNTLGSMLAVGLPSVFLIQRRSVRLVGWGLILWAVLWSSARTGIAAVVAVTAVVLIGKALTHKGFRSAAAAVGLVALAVVLWWVPFSTTQPSAFNHRGQVWMGTIHRWEFSPWLGDGPDAFRKPGPFANYLSDYAFHGHNLLVDLLAVGGVLMATVVGLVLFSVAVRATRLYRRRVDFPLLFLVGFLVDGVLEVSSSDFWLPSGPALVVWFSLAGILFGRVPDSRQAAPNEEWRAAHPASPGEPIAMPLVSSMRPLHRTSR